MAKINFNNFKMYAGVSRNSSMNVDVREQFADMIYKNAGGIKAHALASLEIVTSLDGVTSLPVVQGNKLVRAPIPLLAKPATDAAKKRQCRCGKMQRVPLK